MKTTRTWITNFFKKDPFESSPEIHRCLITASEPEAPFSHMENILAINTIYRLILFAGKLCGSVAVVSKNETDAQHQYYNSESLCFKQHLWSEM